MSNQLFSYWGNQTKNILQHLEVIQKVIFIRFLDKVELSLQLYTTRVWILLSDYPPILVFQKIM